MSDEEKLAEFDAEMEELVAEMRAQSPQPACPVDREAREACASCEG